MWSLNLWPSIPAAWLCALQQAAAQSLARGSKAGNSALSSTGAETSVLSQQAQSVSAGTNLSVANAASQLDSLVDVVSVAQTAQSGTDATGPPSDSAALPSGLSAFLTAFASLFQISSAASNTSTSTATAGATVQSLLSAPATIDTPDDPAIAKVKAELEAEGVDPSSVTLTSRQDLVEYATGARYVSYLRAATSDGRYVDFDARLSEKSPAVTVCDIKHMLNHEGGWGEVA
jgi:hypothetical protein